jgi:hypothetical protein
VDIRKDGMPFPAPFLLGRKLLCRGDFSAAGTKLSSHNLVPRPVYGHA